MKTVVKMLVIGVILTGLVSSAGADTITIQGSDEVIDSFLLGSDSSTPTANQYGSRVTVDVNKVSGGYNRNGIFRWDLGNVPVGGSAITKVEIMLYVDNYGGSTQTRSYDLRQITGGDWVELEVTAKTRKTGINWINQTASPWGDLSTETCGTVDVSQSNVWVTFSSDDDTNLLTLVQGMVNGTVSNHGFSVEGKSATTVVVHFRSTDHGTASTQPKMVITYDHQIVTTIQGPDKVIDSFLLGTDNSTPTAGQYGSRTTVDVNGGSGAYNRNGIFRWNLDNVPVCGSKITRVDIMLYVDSFVAGNYTLRQITGGDWVESEVSAVNRSTGPDMPWINQTASPWGDLSAETYGMVNVSQANVWVTFSSSNDPDLLTLVQGMVDNTISNHGFSVVGPASDLVTKFRSTDHGTASTRPKMLITSYPPPKGTLIIIK